MRRPPHGGTVHPGLCRPTNGYGRPARPGPVPGRDVRLLGEPARATNAAVPTREVFGATR